MCEYAAAHRPPVGEARLEREVRTPQVDVAYVAVRGDQIGALHAQELVGRDDSEWDLGNARPQRRGGRGAHDGAQGGGQEGGQVRDDIKAPSRKRSGVSTMSGDTKSFFFV